MTKMQDIKTLLAKAKKSAYDGNWPECYFEDVTWLLKQLQRALPTKRRHQT